MSDTNQLEVSIAFQTNKKISEYATLGKQVENFGFDRVTVYNDMLYQPAWIPLTIMAQVTSIIKLGPAAVNPFTNHPVSIAGNIALLNEISKGRAYLGVARGAWLDFVGIKHENPITALKEAFACIHHLLARNKNPLKGIYFPLLGGDTLRWEISYPKIPMLLGSWGLRTLEFCYPFVSEVKIGGTTNPEFVKYFKFNANQIKQKSNYINQINVVTGAVCVVDEDHEKAKELAKKEVALYLPVVAKLDKTLNLDPVILENINIAMSTFDYSLISEYISDELLQKFAFAGDAEHIIKQTINLFEVGVSRVEFGTPHGIEMNKGVDLLGKEVLPVIKDYILAI